METPSKSNSHSRPFCSLSESVPVWEKGRPLLKQKVRRFISKNRNVRAVSPHVPNYLVPDCFLIQKVSLEVADSCIFQMDQQTTDFRRYNGSTLSESWFPMSFRPTSQKKRVYVVPYPGAGDLDAVEGAKAVICSSHIYRSIPCISSSTCRSTAITSSSRVRSRG